MSHFFLGKNVFNAAKIWVTAVCASGSQRLHRPQSLPSAAKDLASQLRRAATAEVVSRAEESARERGDTAVAASFDATASHEDGGETVLS